MQCQIAALSRAGGREQNEDACGYIEKDGMVCCVLADGAGGHQGGDVASRICVQSVLDEFVTHPEISHRAIGSILHNANQAVLRQQQDNPALADMRSTLVVLLFDPTHRSAIWGHIGDSRLYMFRGGVIHLRTWDHSLIQSMVDGGILRQEDASSHPESNVLFASIGLPTEFQPTAVETPTALNEGDAFLLCSDGVWSKASDIDIAQCLVSATTADAWLRRIEQLVSTQIVAGADNYSAIAVWCGDPGDFMRTVPG